MNQEIFEQGYAAYQSGDWSAAEAYFASAKDPGEVSGRTDHLRGNALMQVGRYEEAAAAYGEALKDSAYGMVGALSTNRGRALVAAGKVREAIDSLNQATQDSSYATPYKAYLALGGAYRAIGDTRSAGIAYRNAAIDEANPDPSASLRKLGGCFMELGRPADAVESYRTALDFSNNVRSQNAIYCDLALAYVATNRMTEAVDAFDHATADGSFKLSAEAQASYDAARNAVAARSGERRRSDTDDFLAAAGYDSYPVDPLDPTGETSGNLMPSPEDTGFFSISEEEIVKEEKKRRKGVGGKIVIVLVIVLVLLGVAGGFAYYSGFGWPMQETVVTDMFKARTDGEDISRFVSSSVDDESRRRIEAFVPKGAKVTINGVTRSMSNSEVNLTVTLAEGGERSYVVQLVRDGIGWKVSNLTPAFVSQDGSVTKLDSSQSSSDSSSSSSQSTSSSEQSSAEPAVQEEQPQQEQPQEENTGNNEGEGSSE